MALTEAEELELLELEEAEAKNTPTQLNGNSIFPLASKAESKKGKVLGGIVDLLTIPTRAAGTLRGGNFGDPESNIVQPEINQMNDLIDKSNLPFKGPGKTLQAALMGAVADPLTYLGVGIPTLIKTGAKKAATTAAIRGQTKIGTEKLLESAAPSRGFVETIMGRIPENERSILSEALLPKETPFTDYSKIAKVAVKNPRNMTSFDYAGSVAKKAFDELDTQRKAAGAAKQAILTGNAEKTINASDIKTTWFKEVYDKMGFSGFDKDGNILAIKGRTIRNPGDVSTVKEMDAIINQLPDEMTVQQADDVKSAIRSIIDNKKASQVKQMKSTAEGIATGIRKQIDDKLDAVLGPDYKAANKEYAETIELQKWLNSRLGESVGDKGVTRHGGSLMKSAVQSTAERGAKASFEAIKKKTGFDLVKEAKYAEISSKAVDDPRAWNLLEEAHGTNTGSGIVDMLLQVGKKGYNILNPKINEYDRFYEAMQRKHMKGDL